MSSPKLTLKSNVQNLYDVIKVTILTLAEGLEEILSSKLRDRGFTAETRL